MVENHLEFMMFDLVIKNGTIILKDGNFSCDIAVQNGKVAALLQPGEPCASHETVEAAGLLVLPGLIDAHMHVEAPFQGITGQLSFFQQSICAAFSGVTSFMDFTNTWKGQSVVAALENRLEQMSHSAIDYGVHGKFVEAGPEVLAEIPELVRRGCPTFKLFMTYRKEGVMADDDTLVKVFTQAKKHNGLPMIHAESNALAEAALDKCRAEKRMTWIDFARAKPVICETEAFARAVHLAEATGSPLLIVHTTNGPCVDIAKAAQQRGVRVYVETCPHYLTLFDDLYSDPDNGHLALCSPPLRTPKERDELWRGIKEGTISLVGSDDCTFTRAEKEMFVERDASGRIIQDFTKVVNGLSGLETRLAIMSTEGVAKGRITMNELVALCSTNVAQRMGCYPQKGTLLPGADADIVLFDPKAQWTIRAENMHNQAGYSLYEGYEVTGQVVRTIARGKTIMANQTFLGAEGQGQFIHRRL